MSTHFGPIPVSGHRNAYAFMTNAIYDFTFGWPVTPHLGLGVGAVQLHDSISRKAPAIPISIASSSDWEFGYQGIAGIRYNINPALAFDLDYRYLATTDPTFKTVTGAKYRSEYTTHNVVASLSARYQVGARAGGRRAARWGWFPGRGSRFGKAGAGDWPRPWVPRRALRGGFFLRSTCLAATFVKGRYRSSSSAQRI